MRGDVARGQPAAVEREDLVVEPDEPPLALADDLRLKAPVAVAGRVDPDLPVLGDQRLRRRAVARVAGAAGRLLVRLVADVVGQLDLHRPLHQALGQLGQQPAGPGDLLLRARAGEQLVDQLVADPPIGRHPESLPDAAAVSRPVDRLIDQPRPAAPGGPRRARRAEVAQRQAQLAPARWSRRRSTSARSQPRAPQAPVALQLGPGPALLRPASRSRRHSDLLRSCLHRSSDNPLAV